jgi:hypothetical protein
MLYEEHGTAFSAVVHTGLRVVPGVICHQRPGAHIVSGGQRAFEPANAVASAVAPDSRKSRAGLPIQLTSAEALRVQDAWMLHRNAHMLSP